MASHLLEMIYGWLSFLPVSLKAKRAVDSCSMAKEADDHFRGGKRLARDRHYGISNKAFWRWWHKQEKDKHGGDNLDKSAAWHLFDLGKGLDARRASP